MNPQESQLAGQYVLIVDDQAIVRETLSDLCTHYGMQPIVAETVEAASTLLGEREFSFVLLDIHLKEGNGLDLLRLPRLQYPFTEFIIISGTGEIEQASEAIRLGAAGYLCKPIRSRDLERELLRISERRRHRERESNEQVQLRLELEKRTRQFLVTQNRYVTIQRSLIQALCRLAEFRDMETGDHLQRLSLYCQEIALGLRQILPNPETLNDIFIRDLSIAVPLHDIGKAGIPDSILLKPGALTPQEYDVMKTHTTIGASVIDQLLAKNSHDQEEPDHLLRLAADIARTHHERWDGTGYPAGLAGKEIPLAGRITAVADVYDALSMPRVYRKEAWSHERICALIRENREKMFDPDIVDAFFLMEDKVLAHRAAFSAQAAPHAG